MGHVYSQVELSAEKTAKVRMFVDTGATFSIISADLARAIGVQTLKKPQRVKLADGRMIKMKAGSAHFRINGREAANIVLIGPVDEPILGVEAMEALGLAVDPISERLKPTRSYAARLGGFR